MRINQTGAGFHRDSRKEARMGRKAARDWAIGEQGGCGDPLCEDCAQEWPSTRSRIDRA